MCKNERTKERKNMRLTAIGISIVTMFCGTDWRHYDANFGILVIASSSSYFGKKAMGLIKKKSRNIVDVKRLNEC
ncbi:hypothetical protein L3i20_v218230 [Paenibacillus sp. L3-i20]|nr:hypothetical protein L3i20_v218230 [Paenibacillus sp. L3-i20]